MKGRAVKMLRELRFQSHIRGGPYLLARISQRGVPHLTAKIGDTTYSVTYFARKDKRHFKVFWPWGTGRAKQEVRQFKKIHEVVAWLMDRREGVVA